MHNQCVGILNLPQETAFVLDKLLLRHLRGSTTELILNLTVEEFTHFVSTAGALVVVTV